MAERVIETLRVERIRTRDWESEDELRLAIETWLVGYNHRRPHRALAWLTPAEKRELNLGQHGGIHAITLSTSDGNRTQVRALPPAPESLTRRLTS